MLIVIYCLGSNTSAIEYQEVPNLISHFDTGVKRADQHSEGCVHTLNRQADILSMRGVTNQQEEMMKARLGSRQPLWQRWQPQPQKHITVGEEKDPCIHTTPPISWLSYTVLLKEQRLQRHWNVHPCQMLENLHL